MHVLGGGGGYVSFLCKKKKNKQREKTKNIGKTWIILSECVVFN